MSAISDSLLPAPNEIQTWSTDQLIGYLRKTFGNNLYEADLRLIKSHKIDGVTFLGLKEEKLLSLGMKYAPAHRIVQHVQTLKGTYISNVA